MGWGKEGGGRKRWRQAHGEQDPSMKTFGKSQYPVCVNNIDRGSKRPVCYVIYNLVCMSVFHLDECEQLVTRKLQMPLKTADAFVITPGRAEWKIACNTLFDVLPRLHAHILSTLMTRIIISS